MTNLKIECSNFITENILVKGKKWITDAGLNRSCQWGNIVVYLKYMETDI
jgi:hypothetical protein